MGRRAVISRPIPAVTAQVRPGAAVEPVVVPGQFADGLLDVDGACKFLSCSRSELYAVMREKRIGWYRILGRRKVPKRLLEEFCDRAAREG